MFDPSSSDGMTKNPFIEIFIFFLFILAAAADLYMSSSTAVNILF
jgi:hypothetical protein